MKITEDEFNAEMSAAFADGLCIVLEQEKTDTFAFAYTGGDGSPAGCQDDMTCVVLLWPTPLAQLLLEGIPTVKAEMDKVAAAAKAGVFDQPAKVLAKGSGILEKLKAAQ